MSNNQTTVFVGLSGGVDSSVAALRLKQDGFNVVGVFIKVWQPEFLDCNWEAERLDAMRVAAKLEIPFLTCNAVDAYKNEVADYFINEYQAGRTPNPDVMCNKHVKFGAFLKFAKQHGADMVATGHYARRELANSEYTLRRGKDQGKDQSYFLWTLTQDQLKHVLLPIGDSDKSTIRNEAQKNGLITAKKKDSQGICFLGHVDIAEFLSHYIDLIPGQVLDEAGEVIGTHKGALIYTIGQRHGFTIKNTDSGQRPYYIVSRDVETNTITVTTKKPKSNQSELVELTDCNYIAYGPVVGDTLEIQTRYRQEPTAAEVVEIQANKLTLSLKQPSESISIGQSCVLYRGEQCLGGGIIAGCQ